MGYWGANAKHVLAATDKHERGGTAWLSRELSDETRWGLNDSLIGPQDGTEFGSLEEAQKAQGFNVFAPFAPFCGHCS